MDLSISAQLPTTNDLGGLKRRIVNDGEDLENQGLLDLTRNVGKKKRASVVSSEPLEENHPIPNGDSVVGSEYVDVREEGEIGKSVEKIWSRFLDGLTNGSADAVGPRNSC